MDARLAIGLAAEWNEEPVAESDWYTLVLRAAAVASEQARAELGVVADGVPVLASASTLLAIAQQHGTPSDNVDALQEALSVVLAASDAEYTAVRAAVP